MVCTCKILTVDSGLDWTGLGPENVPCAFAMATWWSDVCMLRVLAHAPAMDEVVVISSESSTESDGELNLHSYEATTIPRSVQNDTLCICECREVNCPV